MTKMPKRLRSDLPPDLLPNDGPERRGRPGRRRRAIRPLVSSGAMLPRLRSVPSALVSLALLFSLLGAAPASAARSGELTCERIPELLYAYLQKHIRFHYVNDALRERVVESYLRRLDPSKTLYLKAEADAISKRLKGVLLDLNDRDCSTLDDVKPDLVARYERMEEYVRKFVESEKYAIDPEISLISDPEKRSRPATAKERDALIERLVHFQMANYKMIDLDLAESKEKLIHRYELMTRRASELDQRDVYTGFLDSFARALDPHSNYLSPESFEDFGIGMNLSLEGIGVALSSRDGYSVVENIIPGGAADENGELLKEDKIVAVSQADEEWVDVVDKDLRDVVKLIRGPRGTLVRLRLLRRKGDDTQRIDVTLKRKRITLEEQAAKLRFETVERDGSEIKLAVIELPSFYGDRNPTKRQSSRDMRKLLKEAKEGGAQGLLLDLSRNGGGLLENAVEIAGLFIDEGGVVAVKDIYAKLQVLRDPDRGVVYDGPMVVLTSRVSASASEIVAGAMKDYRRALLVGDDHTFGKGTVQSMVALGEELGALKVTTAMFFRPGGVSTQNDGVEADIVIPSPFSVDEVGERNQPFAIESQRIAPFLDAGSVVTLEPNEDTTANENMSVVPMSTPWPSFDDQLLSQLSERSAKRVSSSEEFQQILEELEKNKARGGVIQVSELLEADEEPAELETSALEPDAIVPEQGEDGAAAASANDGSEPATAAASKAGEAGEAAENEEEDEKPSPQQREAIEILADFVSLSGRSVPALAEADGLKKPSGP